MLKDEYIIYLSNIFWHETWFSKQSFAFELSKHNKVLFVNSPINLLTSFKDKDRYLLKQKPLIDLNSNLTVFTPFYLFPYHKLKVTLSHAEKLLLSEIKKIISDNTKKQPIVIINSPEHHHLLSHLNEKISVYHCTDDYSSLPEINTDHFLKEESALLKKVKLVLCVSEKLVKDKHKQNPNTYLFPNAVKLDNFSNLDSMARPSEMYRTKPPILTFVGSINDRLDFDLITDISRNFPGSTLLFVGPKGKRLFTPENYNRLKNLPNVKLTGSIPHAHIPAFLKFSDVCLIPYTESNFNLSSDPLKIYEYLAAGKPAVVTNLPSFNKLEQYIYLSKNDSEFIANISKALSEQDPSLTQSRISEAKKNSWTARVNEFSTLISKFLK